MIFTPVNNYLWVRPVEDSDAEESGILLPQDYRAAESPFAVVEVLSQVYTSGPDAADMSCWTVGTRLVVEAQMLRDIQHKNETFTVIKENYVIGILSETP